MPRSLAVLRLITSSNLVGCWTGKSRGLGALQNTIDISGRAQEQLGVIDAIGHQAAGRGERAREYTVGRRCCGGGSEDGIAMHDGEDIRQNQQSAALPARKLAIIDWISAASWHGALCAVTAKEGAASSMSRIISPA